MRLRHPILGLLVVLGVLISACGGRTTPDSPSSPDGTTLTVYSATGLGAWYKTQFEKFTKETNIKVNVAEAGSGELVSRVEKERNDPNADLLVVLPPFIQKAAQAGLLQPSDADTTGITSSWSGRPVSTCPSSTTR